MSLRLSSETVKAEARDLGFIACGIAKAEPVNSKLSASFRRWLELKWHADMAYMANHTDKRLNPTLLMEGVKSIACVALSYAPERKMPDGEPRIAAYALGLDYHDVMKRKLHSLAARLGLTNYRAFCDSAPVLERYWAERSGIGWTGRNHQLIVPGAGSMVFLGELFLDIELDYDTPMKTRCGTCRACVEACPTGALACKETADDAFSAMNAGLCLSYLTIENRGEIPPELASKMGDTIYGCDRCQEACPWNKGVRPTTVKEFTPNDALLRMTRASWNALSVEEYRRLFKGSAVKRTKYDGLKRNIKAINDSSDRQEEQTSHY